LTSRMIRISRDNIDTDQIIPARFLKTTGKAGLGAGLFADWRYSPDGKPRASFPLNRPENRGARILLAGDNFGCGSSREHAPWALMDFGLRAIISTSFADIFRQNALKNSLLPVEVDADIHWQLSSLADKAPQVEITIALPSQTIMLPDGRQVSFPIDVFSKACLVEGIDQLGYLLKHESRIIGYEQMHPARVNTSIR
jgi:3-isopropylmalate/(R)-2-methylmalate dehydratase small subunit